MAVDDPQVIDAMGHDRTSGEIVLTISDHLDWLDERAHLEALEAKAKAYFEFVQSGQVYEESCAAVGTPVRIDVIAKYEIPESVRWFFQAVDDAAEGNGVTFAARQLPAGY